VSRQINVYDHKITDEERAYLESRGRRHQIMYNDREFSDEAVAARAEKVEDEETWEEIVMSLKVDELRAELEAREMDSTGVKAELQDRLIKAGPGDED